VDPHPTKDHLSLHLTHFSAVAFSVLFCGWTPVTSEDLAQKRSAPTRCALTVKPNYSVGQAVVLFIVGLSPLLVDDVEHCGLC
jgi:hypothetical protein